jgi:AsmA protein
MDPLKDCGPDKEMLIEVTKDYAEYKIKQKHGAKIEEKKQEVKAKVEDKKKKLFDKLQKKLGGSTEEASAEEAPTEEKPTAEKPIEAPSLEEKPTEEKPAEENSAESAIDSTQSSEASSQAENQL